MSKKARGSPYSLEVLEERRKLAEEMRQLAHEWKTKTGKYKEKPPQ